MSKLFLRGVVLKKEVGRDLGMYKAGSQFTSTVIEYVVSCSSVYSDC